VSRTSIQVALGRHISHLRDGCAHHRRPPALRRPPRFLPRRAGARTRRARKGHNHHADSSPYPAHYRTPQGNPTFGEILWEVTDLAGGAVVMLLPLLLLAVPGIVLSVVLPALVLLAVATALAVVAGRHLRAHLSAHPVSPATAGRAPRRAHRQPERLAPLGVAASPAVARGSAPTLTRLRSRAELDAVRLMAVTRFGRGAASQRAQWMPSGPTVRVLWLRPAFVIARVSIS
jgi:hypothetical protein